MPNWIWIVCCLMVPLSLYSWFLAWRYASGYPSPRWLGWILDRRRFADIEPSTLHIVSLPPTAAIRKRGKLSGQVLN